MLIPVHLQGVIIRFSCVYNVCLFAFFKFMLDN